MKNIIILVALSLSNIACKSVPQWPAVISHIYAIDFGDIEPQDSLDQYIINIESLNEYRKISRAGFSVTCLKFKILQQNPFQIEYEGWAPLKHCQGLTGLPPGLFQALINWIDDVYRKFGPKQEEEQDQ